jgi:hypothetical protein
MWVTQRRKLELEQKRHQLRNSHSHSPRINRTVGGKPFSPTADFQSRQDTWQQERTDRLARRQQQVRHSHSPQIKGTVAGKPFSPGADFQSRQDTWQRERIDRLARRQHECAHSHTHSPQLNITVRGKPVLSAALMGGFEARQSAHGQRRAAKASALRAEQEAEASRMFKPQISPLAQAQASHRRRGDDRQGGSGRLDEEASGQGLWRGLAELRGRQLRYAEEVRRRRQAAQRRRDGGGGGEHPSKGREDERQAYYEAIKRAKEQARYEERQDLAERERAWRCDEDRKGGVRTRPLQSKQRTLSPREGGHVNVIQLAESAIIGAAERLHSHAEEKLARQERQRQEELARAARVARREAPVQAHPVNHERWSFSSPEGLGSLEDGPPRRSSSSSSSLPTSAVGEGVGGGGGAASVSTTAFTGFQEAVPMEPEPEPAPAPAPEPEPEPEPPQPQPQLEPEFEREPVDGRSLTLMIEEGHMACVATKAQLHGVSDMEQLTSILKQKVGVAPDVSVRVVYMDEDFQEWIPCWTLDDLSHMCKVQVRDSALPC